MRFQRKALTALTLLCLLAAKGVSQEGTAITWESYKEVEFDFGESLLRVGSDYQAYAFATGAPPAWLAPYGGPELTEITAAITTDFASTQVSPPGATASAVTGWLLQKDDASGIATLSNAAAGTTAIVDKYDPTVAALSWAAQSTSLEVGEEVSQGTIDWSPGILVGAAGGSFVSAHNSVSIHDPIVVWTRAAGSDVIERTTLFELTAEFDAKTVIHWNEVRRIETGVDGAPELVLIPNDGPFLDAGNDGSGSFRLRLDSDLLPAAKRGTLAVDFQNGLVTSSSATGVFSQLAPVQDGAVLGRLPQVGSPAIIDSILVDNDDANGRFALSVDVGQDRVITDVAACSDGVHVSVGPGIDTIQTFTLNPLQRSPVAQVNVNAANNGQPRPCLGDVREDADLLFGTAYSPADHASLHRESSANPIDRFLRLNVGADAPQRTIVFHQGRNSSPADTRRWTAKFDVRLAELPGPVPMEPADVTSVEDAVTGGLDDAVIRIDATSTVATDAKGATFAIGLLDVATYGDAPAVDGDLALSPQQPSLFRKTAGVVLTVMDRPDDTVARLAIDGNVIAEAGIPLKHRLRTLTKDPWRHFELGLERQPAGVEIQLNLVGQNGDAVYRVMDETIPDMQLSAAGYRLALGSLVQPDGGTHDFDNLLVTFQQSGDVAWDGAIDVEDFRLVQQAIESKLQASMLDIDLNGQIDVADLELIEDLIPNKTPGDANFDGSVNFADFLALSASFGETTGLWSRGDFDANGRVEFRDFLVLSRNYSRPSVRDPQLVPEPATFSLWLLGICAVSRLRTSGKTHRGSAR